jgi:hypothetical protein
MLPKYDTSTKEFEVQRIQYKYDKYTRKRLGVPKWKHFKYYRSLQGATDALRDLRRSFYDAAYYDYPAMGNPLDEALYPHIKPTITINRYRAIKRFE